MFNYFFNIFTRLIQTYAIKTMCDNITNTDVNQTISRLDSLLEICIENVIQNNATNELLLTKIQLLTDRIESLKISNQIYKIDNHKGIEDQIEIKRSILNNNNHPIDVNIKIIDSFDNYMMPSTSKIRENNKTNEHNEIADTISINKQDLIECGVFLLNGNGYRVKLDKNLGFITSMTLTIIEAKKNEAKEKADKEKADKEKADKEKADKENADKEKADKEKADKEKAEIEKAGNHKLKTEEVKEKATKAKKTKNKTIKENDEKDISEKIKEESFFKEYYAPYKWYIINNTTGEKKKVQMKSEDETLKTVIDYNKIEDFPLRLFMGCRPTLFVWRLKIKKRLGKITWGHISLLLSDGTYISFWPEAKQKTTWRTLEDDVAEERVPPHEMHSLDFFKFFKMDENAIKQWWPGFLKTDSYNPIHNNCAHVVMKALIVGDVWMKEPLKRRLLRKVNRKTKFWTPVRSPCSVGEHIDFIIEQTINNPEYRYKKFVPHAVKSGSGHVDVSDERLEQYFMMQSITNDLFKHFTNNANE